MESTLFQQAPKATLFSKAVDYLFDGLELCLPKNLVPSDDARTKIMLSANSLEVFEDTRRTDLFSTEHGINEDALAEFVARSIQTKQKVDLIVDTSLALDLTVEAFSRVTRICDQIVENAVILETPFGADNTLAFWQASNKAASDHTLQICIVPRDEVEPVIIALLENGLTIGKITRASEERMQAWSAKPDWLSFDDEKADNTSFSKFQRVTKTFPASMKIMLVCLGVLLTSALANITYTQNRLASLGPEAQNASAILRDAALKNAVTNQLNKQRRATLNRIAILNEIANDLDDETWLNRYRINENSIELSGFTPSAAETLRKIAAIEGTTNVRLLSSVVRDQNRNLERFRLGLDVQ